MGWNGAGGWVMVSQARHENRSRTVWMTFHLIGSASKVSVMSSPSLDSLPLQQGHAVGLGRTTRSRGRWAGRGARTGWPRGGLSGRRVLPSLPAAPSTLAASSLAAATNSPSSSSNWSSSLRPRSEEAPYLSCLSRAISSLRCATIASAPEARASASRRADCSAASAVRSVSISSGMVSGAGITAEIESYPTPACQPYPATSGRQVRCGFRQSMPSSM